MSTWLKVVLGFGYLSLGSLVAVVVWTVVIECATRRNLRMMHKTTQSPKVRTIR